MLLLKYLLHLKLIKMSQMKPRLSELVSPPKKVSWRMMSGKLLSTNFESTSSCFDYLTRNYDPEKGKKQKKGKSYLGLT